MKQTQNKTAISAKNSKSTHPSTTVRSHTLTIHINGYQTPKTKTPRHRFDIPYVKKTTTLNFLRENKPQPYKTLSHISIQNPHAFFALASLPFTLREPRQSQPVLSLSLCLTWSVFLYVLVSKKVLVVFVCFCELSMVGCVCFKDSWSFGLL